MFTRNLEKEDLSALYANAKLFVFPSEAEGMPMALLEAMWFDCPCLVSDIPENTEVTNGAGQTFPVGDSEGLATSLSALLLSPPERRDTRTMVRREHDWWSVAEDTEKVYEGLIA